MLYGTALILGGECEAHKSELAEAGKTLRAQLGHPGSARALQIIMGRSGKSPDAPDHVSVRRPEIMGSRSNRFNSGVPTTLAVIRRLSLVW